MDNKTKEYLKQSRKFAIKQLMERWIFEIQINKELFNTIPSLDDLIAESHNVINLDYNEYLDIYNKSINSIK